MTKHKFYRKGEHETIERITISEAKSGEIHYGNRTFTSIEQLEAALSERGWVREPVTKMPYDTFQRSAR